jgi:hypothetical protein
MDTHSLILKISRDLSLTYRISELIKIASHLVWHIILFCDVYGVRSVVPSILDAGFADMHMLFKYSEHKTFLYEIQYTSHSINITKEDDVPH